MRTFDELFSQYFERVYRFALSLTRSEQAAEELTQQTFYKALNSITSFKGRSDPATWLCSIAKNEYFSGVKRNREHAVEPDSPVFEANGCSVEDMLLRDEHIMSIHKQLHALSEPYREVFSLRVFSDLTFSQIATLFSKTESWARVTFYRAKCILRDRIREDEDNEK